MASPVPERKKSQHHTGRIGCGPAESPGSVSTPTGRIRDEHISCLSWHQRLIRVMPGAVIAIHPDFEREEAKLGENFAMPPGAYR